MTRAPVASIRNVIVLSYTEAKAGISAVWSEEMTSSPSSVLRIFCGVAALILAHLFIVAPAQNTWKNYWLTKDGQQGKAVVTKVPSFGYKNGVVYRYRVNGKEYTGEGSAEYAHRVVGGEPVVFFSASHPWLSSLTRPRTAMVEGLPVLVLAWLFFALFVITAINPKSKWALNAGPNAAKSDSTR